MGYLGPDKADKMSVSKDSNQWQFYHPDRSVKLASPGCDRQAAKLEKVTVTMLIFGVPEQTYRV